MHNIESFYPVVGVLEDMNSTLAVLQRKLPRFFGNVTTLYKDRLKGNILDNAGDLKSINTIVAFNLLNL